MKTYLSYAAQGLFLVFFIGIVLPWAFNNGTTASVLSVLFFFFGIIPGAYYINVRKEVVEEEQYDHNITPN